MTPRAPLRRMHKTHKPRPRGEEGMALLLVLLLIVMVSAAGIYASQNSSSEIRSAGFQRHAAQTHYVSESGVVASLDQLRRRCSAYVAVMQDTVARSMEAVPAGLDSLPLTYRFYVDDFAASSAGLVGAPVFQATSRSGASVQPGSFGPGAFLPIFGVTATLFGRSPRPVPGFSVGGGRDIEVMTAVFELTSEGSIRLSGVSDGNFQTTSTEQARVLAEVPCL